MCKEQKSLMIPILFGVSFFFLPVEKRWLWCGQKVEKLEKKESVGENSRFFFLFLGVCGKKLAVQTVKKSFCGDFSLFFFACYKQAVDFFILKLPLKKSKTREKPFVCISTSFQTIQNGKRWVVENSVETVKM